MAAKNIFFILVGFIIIGLLFVCRGVPEGREYEDDEETFVNLFDLLSEEEQARYNVARFNNNYT